MSVEPRETFWLLVVKEVSIFLILPEKTYTAMFYGLLREG